jgi:molybdenum cofactor biosynthesis protein B
VSTSHTDPIDPPDARGPLRVATLTLSDTRTPETDEGGRVLGELLRGAGFKVVSHEILREDPHLLRETLIHSICALDVADAVVMTGGTGIAPRDRTIEAITPVLQKVLDGFGEAFRRLSWEEVGAHAILSRAVAGVVRGRVVIALPGSVKAVRLATLRLIIPMLPHACELASGRTVSHVRTADTPERP